MFIKALIALLILALPSCNKPRQKDVLIIADADKIDKESVDDPAALQNSVIGDLVFNTLSYVDNDLIPHNLLIEEVRPLPGGKTIEIKIRKGIRFHDGMEMTESDVAASISRIIERDEYLKERYGQLKVAIVDKLKIRVTGDNPLADIDTVLLPNLYISLKGLGGTGPYSLAYWLYNGVELEANEDYFEGRPKIKKIRYLYEEDERKRVNMLLKGEADLLVWLSPEMAGFLKPDSRFYVKEITNYSYSALFLNNESPLFRDKALRRAVSMAIDRDKLIKKVLKGSGTKASGPLPSYTFQQENDTASQNYRPREAFRLLKDAGWRDADGDGILEKNGKKLRFRLYYNSNVEEFKKMADLISQDLFEIGIGVEAIPADMGESTDRNFKPGNYDAILNGKSSYDSVNLLTWGSSSLSNLSRFSNREMDTLLERLKEATNIEQKKEIYNKMQRIFEEEVPAVFLYNPVIYTAASKRFKGAEDFVGSAYSMYKIKDWSVNEDYE
ncbi:MAG: ABC transporter substrate-binding protein [Nitrospirae bacterium]|nr:ABC transporter substrate-binding protein [Nitrospirota bacterium]